MLLSEAAKAFRFEKVSVRNAASELGMLSRSGSPRKLPEPVGARLSTWVLAHHNGILHTKVPLDE